MKFGYLPRQDQIVQGLALLMWQDELPLVRTWKAGRHDARLVGLQRTTHSAKAIFH